MRHLRQRFKAIPFAALAIFTFACCSGCALGGAMIDGVFLGVSETVRTLVSNVFVG